MVDLAAAVRALDRRTMWTLVDEKPLAFDAFHPQGLARFDGGWLLSTVEVLEPPRVVDGGRTPGRGRGFVVRLDDAGRETGRARVDVDGDDRYHPGGVAVVDGRLLVPVAEYRPDSRARLVAVDPRTLAVAHLFDVDDHVGAVLPGAGRLHLATWGSRRWLDVVDGRVVAARANPTHAVDFQDGQAIGGGLAICTGVAELPAQSVGGVVDERQEPAPSPATRAPVGAAGGGRDTADVRDVFQLGGIALVELATSRVVHEVPVVALSPRGRVLTRNPTWFDAPSPTATGRDAALRLTCVPDDGAASLLVYRAGA